MWQLVSPEGGGGVTTHNKFQTHRALRTGVIGRIVSGTNKTKNFFRLIVVWNFGGRPPMRGWLCIKNVSPLRHLEQKLRLLWSRSKHHVYGTQLQSIESPSVRRWLPPWSVTRTFPLLSLKKNIGAWSTRRRAERSQETYQHNRILRINTLPLKYHCAATSR